MPSEDQVEVYRTFLDRFTSLHFRNLASQTTPFDFESFPEGRPKSRLFQSKDCDLYHCVGPWHLPLLGSATRNGVVDSNHAQGG